MYIYQVNPDGMTCAVQVHREENGPIPIGWTEVPANLNPHRLIYINQDMPTNEKPQAMIDQEEQEKLIREREEKLIRDQAIAELKAEGKLPADFKALSRGRL